MNTVKINTENFNSATLMLGKAQSILMLLSSYHQFEDQTLFQADLDNVVTAASDLISGAEKLMVCEKSGA